jgi:hypothetical protein
MQFLFSPKRRTPTLESSLSPIQWVSDIFYRRAGDPGVKLTTTSISRRREEMDGPVPPSPTGHHGGHRDNFTVTSRGHGDRSLMKMSLDPFQGKVLRLAIFFFGTSGTCFDITLLSFISCICFGIKRFCSLFNTLGASDIGLQ